MRAATLIRIGARTALALFWMVSATGCQKLCQQAATTAFKSVTDSDWRLIRSTDPQVSPNLSNYTFLIWHFDATFGGTITAVQNNQKFDNPVKTFTWNPNEDTKVMAITFFGQGSQDENGQVQQGASEGTTYYQYDLGTKLTLFDTTRSYEYDFVQFTGAVLPDANCSF